MQKQQRRKGQSANQSFYCLCHDQKAYQFESYNELRKHVQVRHANEKRISDAPLEERAKEEEQILIQKYLNGHQIGRLGTVDKAAEKINIILMEGHIESSHYEQSYEHEEEEEEPEEGDEEARDFYIMEEEEQLKQLFEIQSLLKISSKYLEFEGYNQKRGGISMKKELSQIYCIKWAAMIHIQLDLFACQVWSQLNEEEMFLIERCQCEMWGSKREMVVILKEYYQQVLQIFLKE